MLETPHVAVGAAIATKLVNPFLALPVAFLSHFVLEKVPHWNPHLNSEMTKFGHPTKQTTIIVAADVVISLLLGSYVAYRALPNTNLAITILLASFFSVLPDLVEGPYFFLKKKGSTFLMKWMKFQKSLQVDTTPLPGLFTQAITVAAALIWALG